jgi:hypothetical protein
MAEWGRNYGKEISKALLPIKRLLVLRLSVIPILVRNETHSF